MLELLNSTASLLQFYKFILWSHGGNCEKCLLKLLILDKPVSLIGCLNVCKTNPGYIKMRYDAQKSEIQKLKKYMSANES